MKHYAAYIKACFVRFRPEPGTRTKQALNSSILILISGLFILCSGNAYGVAGDADGSGNTDLKDAVLVLQICAEMNPASGVSVSADVNGDGRIGTEEAAFILQAAAG
ncbi:MAG: hypothetical protein GY795_24705, partial [Desulfobacterales bacterium]|nr:hypothetical protein [Desulfobacterales bacterium]